MYIPHTDTHAYMQNDIRKRYSLITIDCKQPNKHRENLYTCSIFIQWNIIQLFKKEKYP